MAAVTEKPSTPSSGEQQHHAGDSKPAPPTRSEKAIATSSTTDESDEPVPHLHAKTFLAVIAVCLIYMAQLVNLVGAGAVSATSPLLITIPIHRQHSAVR